MSESGWVRKKEKVVEKNRKKLKFERRKQKEPRCQKMQKTKSKNRIEAKNFRKGSSNNHHYPPPSPPPLPPTQSPIEITIITLHHKLRTKLKNHHLTSFHFSTTIFFQNPPQKTTPPNPPSKPPSQNPHPNPSNTIPSKTTLSKPLPRKILSQPYIPHP